MEIMKQKMRQHKFGSGINWLRALKQKGVKQRFINQALGV